MSLATVTYVEKSSPIIAITCFKRVNAEVSHHLNVLLLLVVQLYT